MSCACHSELVRDAQRNGTCLSAACPHVFRLPAIVVDDIDSAAGQVAGAIELRLALLVDGVAGIAFRCPCGCGNEGYLPIRLADMDRRGPEWDWDGNRDAPTLSPSVLNSGMPCKWHGWLRGGEWVTA